MIPLFPGIVGGKPPPPIFFDSGWVDNCSNHSTQRWSCDPCLVNISTPSSWLGWLVQSWVWDSNQVNGDFFMVFYMLVHSLSPLRLLAETVRVSSYPTSFPSILWAHSWSWKEHAVRREWGQNMLRSSGGVGERGKERGREHSKVKGS